MSDFELLSIVFAATGIIVSVLIAWIKDISSRKKITAVLENAVIFN